MVTLAPELARLGTEERRERVVEEVDDGLRLLGVEAAEPGRERLGVRQVEHEPICRSAAAASKLRRRWSRHAPPPQGPETSARIWLVPARIRPPSSFPAAHGPVRRLHNLSGQLRCASGASRRPR